MKIDANTFRSPTQFCTLMNIFHSIDIKVDISILDIVLYIRARDIHTFHIEWCQRCLHPRNSSVTEFVPTENITQNLGDFQLHEK
jgi:hypothetical protein